MDYYHCGIWVAGDGANVALYTIQRTVDEAFPLVHQVKCNLHNGVEDDRQWWNNDVFAWERAVWCWAWGGPNTCPDDPDTPKNEERQSMFWYIMNVLFDCREEGCPNSPPAAPSLLPPPPPYP